MIGLEGFGGQNADASTRKPIAPKVMQEGDGAASTLPGLRDGGGLQPDPGGTDMAAIAAAPVLDYPAFEFPPADNEGFSNIMEALDPVAAPAVEPTVASIEMAVKNVAQHVVPVLPQGQSIAAQTDLQTPLLRVGGDASPQPFIPLTPVEPTSPVAAPFAEVGPVKPKPAQGVTALPPTQTTAKPTNEFPRHQAGATPVSAPANPDPAITVATRPTEIPTREPAILLNRVVGDVQVVDEFQSDDPDTHSALRSTSRPAIDMTAPEGLRTIPTAPIVGNPTLAVPEPVFIQSAGEIAGELPVVSFERSGTVQLQSQLAVDAAPARNPAAAQVQAQAVSNQLATALARSGGDRVEIRLDPPELGRVSVVINITEQAVNAVVSAERPEIIDLMRRHADLLQRDLAESGFGDVSLDFSTSEQADSDTESTPDEAFVPLETIEKIQVRGEVPSGIQPTPAADSRLDIRV